MAFNLPNNLIQQVQTTLRTNAGISSYNPQDPTLPSLPSVDNAISGLDPSPDYLRCKHCKRNFLRGLQSVICIYCGKRHKKEVKPDPIAFNSTLAYRWFLDSLHFDGSEVVATSSEGSKYNRRHNTPKKKIFLSELLDLKIIWADEQDEPEEQLAVSNQIGLSESSTFANTVEKLSLFQEILPSKSVIQSSIHAGADAFTGWAADFRFADARNQHKDSKSAEPIVGSAVVLSDHMDSVYSDSVPCRIDTDLMLDGQANNVNSSVPQQAVLFHSNAEAKNDVSSETLGNKSSEYVDNDWILHDQLNNAGIESKPSSDCVDWLQDNLRQTNIDNAKDMTVKEEDDSFAEWNNFASSIANQESSKNSMNRSGNETTASSHSKPEMDLLMPADNFQEADFGGFSQSDLFSGIGTGEVNYIQSEVPFTNSTKEAEKKVDASSETHWKDDVKMLMSQMHDLSFMVESTLSIPSKPDGVGSFLHY